MKPTHNKNLLLKQSPFERLINSNIIQSPCNENNKHIMAIFHVFVVLTIAITKIMQVFCSEFYAKNNSLVSWSLLARKIINSGLKIISIWIVAKLGSPPHVYKPFILLFLVCRFFYSLCTGGSHVCIIGISLCVSISVKVRSRYGASRFSPPCIIPRNSNEFPLRILPLIGIFFTRS